MGIGEGWLIHAIVFEFADGSRHGTCLNNSGEAMELTDENLAERQVRWQLVQPEERVTRIRGMNSLQQLASGEGGGGSGYLCWGIDVMLSSGRILVGAGSRRDLIGSMYNFRVPTGETLKELRFSGHSPPPPKVAGQVLGLRLFEVSDEQHAVLSQRQMEARRFLLLRHSGQEALVSVEYAVGCLLSTRAPGDFARLNPLIPEWMRGRLLNLLAVLLLRTNRIGQINRCLDDLDGAVASCNRGCAQHAMGKEISGDVTKALRLKLDALLEAVLAPRAFELWGAAKRREADLLEKRALDKAGLEDRENRWLAAHERVSARGPPPRQVLDPRFLVFEFLWMLLLRPRQVDLVLECVETAHKGGGSLVKQMIMGAGKTTVVSPLICLMMAHGDYLVVQCVPPALLPMSSASCARPSRRSSASASSPSRRTARWRASPRS